LLKKRGNYYNLYTLQNKKADLLKTQQATWFCAKNAYM
jgi:hypothetical protein